MEGPSHSGRQVADRGGQVARTTHFSETPKEQHWLAFLALTACPREPLGAANLRWCSLVSIRG